MQEISFGPSGEVSTREWAFGSAQTSRTSIIRHLIMKNQFQSYLEIGVRDFRNFDQIQCATKTGVDPQPVKPDQRPVWENLFVTTSDEFFARLAEDVRFDLIFIDGLHLDEQVSRDIGNSLRHLSEGGCIIMHDCNPPTEFHQREVYKVDGKFPPWNGTTWKAYARRRMTDSGLEMCVVNTDWGVGVIRRGEQALYPNGQDLDWNLLDGNRESLLNLVSVEQFLLDN